MSNMAIKYAMMKKAKKMAKGGMVDDGHQSDCTEHCAVPCDVHEMASGYMEHEGDDVKHNSAAMSEDEDMVGRIMSKRNMYSKGGMVANGGEDDLDEMADGKPNNFDDLALRDDLEFSYDGKNSGDHLGNEQLDEDDSDMIAKIMRSRAKKDRLPNPR